MTRTMIASTIALACAALPAPAARAQVSIPWSTTSVGGGRVNAGEFTLESTLAQPVAGGVREGQFELRSGYLRPPAPPACPGDWDFNGTVDFNDFLAFLNDFNTQAPRADLTGDGVVDFNDLLAFLNLFNTPCP
jgi:hypothetical protein